MRPAGSARIEEARWLRGRSRACPGAASTARRPAVGLGGRRLLPGVAQQGRGASDVTKACGAHAGGTPAHSKGTQGAQTPPLTVGRAAEQQQGREGGRGGAASHGGRRAAVDLALTRAAWL